MKIYLDIDGTIKNTAAPNSDIEAFLLYCMDNFAGHVFWLSSYCRDGSNFSFKALKDILSDEILKRACMEILPANWRDKKLDGIDLSGDFIWFDDYLSETDRLGLHINNVENNFYLSNPNDFNNAKKMLIFLQEKQKTAN